MFRNEINKVNPRNQSIEYFRDNVLFIQDDFKVRTHPDRTLVHYLYTAV